MPNETQVSGPIYQTITGGQIPLSGLSEEEYSFLDIVAKKYSPKQDWTRFAALLLMVSGMQWAMMGVLGEYLWRALDEASGQVCAWPM